MRLAHRPREATHSRHDGVAIYCLQGGETKTKAEGADRRGIEFGKEKRSMIPR